MNTQLNIPDIMKFAIPSLDEVKFQAAKISLPETEAEKFHNYYESVGWVVGRKKMVSWHHAITGWKLRSQERVQRSREISPSAQAILWQTELKRVEERISDLRKRNQCESHENKPWDKEDRVEIKSLKERRVELLSNLGMKV